MDTDAGKYVAGILVVLWLSVQLPLAMGHHDDHDHNDNHHGTPHPNLPNSGLDPKFYAHSCPPLKNIVEAAVNRATKADPTIGPALLRLVFHDCFVRGCDASLLLAGTPTEPSEIQAEPNLTVRGLYVINTIKAALEAACPNTVSCADIIVLAGRHVIYMLQGPFIDVGLGRRDGLISRAAEAASTLPSSHANVSALTQLLQSKGLNTADLVALEGTHTIGRALCLRIQARIMPPDPTISVAYLRSVITSCSGMGMGAFNATTNLFLDPVTPHKFDNQYYKNLLNGEGLLTSDSTLMSEKETKALVESYAKSQAQFFQQYANSFQKISTISVLTGKQGQIRKICSKVNV